MILKLLSYSPLLLAFGLLLTTIGCGSGGEKGVARATGTITLDGAPVPNVLVTFTPQADASSPSPGKSATGQTDAQGKFSLSTYNIDDGAVIGSHVVMVSADSAEVVLPGRLPSNPFVLEVKSGSNNFDIQLTR